MLDRLLFLCVVLGAAVEARAEELGLTDDEVTAATKARKTALARRGA